MGPCVNMGLPRSCEPVRLLRGAEPVPATAPAAPSQLELALGDVITLRGRAGMLDPYQLPPVVAARRLIADTVAQLPMVAVQDGQPASWQPRVLTRPDPAEPRWLTIERLVNDLTRHGRAYLEVTLRDGFGLPYATRALDFDTLAVTFDPYGRLQTATEMASSRRIDTRDLVLIPYNGQRARDRGWGTSPIEDARPIFEGYAALYQMAASYWEAGYPSLAVTTKQRLSDKQADAIKSRIIASWSRRHEPAVIDADGELVPLGASAAEAQLVEALSVVVAETARVFAMPASLINAPAGSSLTYATTESEFRRWLATGLQPMLMRLEDAFTQLLPAQSSARCDASELTRSDVATRADAYATMLGGAPWMTPEEVRALEGLPPQPTTGQLPVQLTAPAHG
jgi:HK97 family phage portal protein